MIATCFLAAPTGVSAENRTSAARELAAAMEDVRGQKWDGLSRLSDPNAQAVVDWFRLRAREGDFAEYLAFLKDYGDWPGLPLLRQRGEYRIPRDAPADRVLEYFAGQEPGTALGALRLASALEAKGRTAEAEKAIIRAWREYPTTPDVVDAFLERYGKILKPHHEERLDMLLWRQRFSEVDAMLPLVPEGQRALARARIGLQRRVNGVDNLVAAVPSDLRDTPGLAYERFVWRVRKGLDDSALELMLETSAAGRLGRPEEWSNRRRSMARQLMRDGKGKTAYELASKHGLTEGSHYADLEWLSGYIALTYLKDPKRALSHFNNHRDDVESPISMGRAGYWRGRAHEAMGNKAEAEKSYREGARHQTSFYGQLAAERIGQPTDPDLLGDKLYPGWKTAKFREASVFKAGILLLEAGELDLAERWFVHLSERLNGDEMGQLADMLLDRDEPHLALKVAKYAASRGIVLQRAYYPVTALAKRDLPVDKSLALSIARRESEFDKSVVSPAGARGLMQLMPATAKAMAAEVGLSYSGNRLLSDGDYNAALGGAYLARLLPQFNGNKALVAAGYNAGPGRPRSWMRTYGDPRTSQVDPVDWIEHVPFRETRNYIMRVMESVPIYRMRLEGKVGPLNLMKELKAGG
ncbi:hypothetical protein ATO5_12195 [Loktanella sp. 22II-4b]|nr:hypothetical protein ATO5_12195 [Loktanella sp. 22II-4b]